MAQLPAASSQNPAIAATFGSRVILSSLWTPEELMGKPEDKFVVRQTGFSIETSLSARSL